MKTTWAHQGALLVGLTSCVASAVVAEDGSGKQIERTTVLASRFEGSLLETSSAVSVMERDDWKTQQLFRLQDALNQAPGVQSFSTAGQVGNTGSLFMRGLPSKYSQVVIDGVRLTDSTNGLGDFLANAHVGQLSSLEVLRGPQSVLYGSEAVGGVVGLRSQLGEGAPTSSLMLEHGAFGSTRGQLASQGQLGQLRYGASLGYVQTENDTSESFPRQSYKQNAGALALGYRVNDSLDVRFSYRASDNVLNTHQVSPFSTSLAEIETDNHLLALNVEWLASDSWVSKLTLGYYDETYDGAFDGTYGASTYWADAERTSLNWDNEWSASDAVRVNSGVEYAESDYSNASGRDVKWSTSAAYLAGAWDVTEDVTLDAGVRYEDHEVHGSDTSWNVGVSQQLNDSTRLRARVAKAFRTPTVLDSEAFAGTFSTQLANPNLKTEELLGFEFGVDHQIADQHQLEITVYQQELENAITSRTIVAGFPSTIQSDNVSGKSKVSGLELALDGHIINEALSYRAAWTWQFENEVVDTPTQKIDLKLVYQADSWLLGGGVAYAEGASYGAPGNVSFVATDDRTVVRLYGEKQLTENLRFHARVENVFDENYLLSNSFGTAINGASVGGFGGFTLQW